MRRRIPLTSHHARHEYRDYRVLSFWSLHHECAVWYPYGTSLRRHAPSDIILRETPNPTGTDVLIPDSASDANALFPPPAPSPLPDYPPPTHVAAQPQNAPAAFLHSTQQKRRQSLNEAWNRSSALRHYRQTPWTEVFSRFEMSLPRGMGSCMQSKTVAVGKASFPSHAIIQHLPSNGAALLHQHAIQSLDNGWHNIDASNSLLTRI
ncbi:hypothetical protein CCHR01_18485 [Colletotrichum chrysophilum]|uniref:Uncharacterized protein n=1 Tax=Colletotrichum chrysophilum TaxID=1836956 RepID=A0AAD9A005_9PEZI|nr:hypothetical protein CCHR01_18485 [Colletotrichum chrysophilum]